MSVTQDIVNGSFKGFAMLRQMVLHAAQAGEAGLEAAGPLPVYIEGCAPQSGCASIWLHAAVL